MITVGKGVARHALGWLAAGNLVGLALSALLVWPSLNDAWAPFTFGRWIPVHLNWQLYGWCALPLLGLLFAWFGRADQWFRGWVRASIVAWSGMLALGGASWLAGDNSGKPFLNWAGWIRIAPPFAMVVSWIALVRLTWVHAGSRRCWENLVRALALALLAPVPWVFYRATNPTTFPPINPDSGGATGTSLLGSTLAVLAVGGAIPWMLRRPLVLGARIPTWAAVWLLIGGIVFAASSHSDVSHHRLTQVLALGTLLVWVPLAPAYFSAFTWPHGARPWLHWSAVWWVLLILSGWIVFLPGVSEETKFTHVFVAHAHLAMAGLVSSIHGVILSVLDPELSWGRRMLWLWQGGGVAHLCVLGALGYYETVEPGAFFTGAGPVPTLLAIRLVIGALLVVPSVVWWCRACT